MLIVPHFKLLLVYSSISDTVPFFVLQGSDLRYSPLQGPITQ